ncbi:MAG: hypothetical protein WCR28_03635 [Candidatus Izemoplasmatales bacterium]|jgi:hypothetical protein|nr:hypothetical protein [Candidatus Izemoplasmatales bacterium]
MSKKQRWESSKIIYFVLAGITLIELIAAIVSVILADLPSVRDASISNIFLAILALILFSIPSLIERKFKFDIPNYLEIIVMGFLFAAIVLGNIHGLLVDVTGYDKVLHTVSGITISLIAFEIIHMYNQTRKVTIRMTPLFVAVFAFTFSITLLVLWEFYEFSVDTLAFQMNADTARNMQRYQWVNESSGFPQDYGLYDTMMDLIVGSIGAAIVSLSGGVILYHKNTLAKKEASLE